MTELFQANFNIIKQRWPEAAEILQHQQIENIDAALVSGANQTISVNGIQLSSRHNRLAETQLFLSTLPASATQATMYGFGMGDVPYIALDEARLSKLTICILNPAIFALVLSYTDHTPWLQHPGVTLKLAPPQQKLFKPYLVIAADLELASDENARLRDLLMVERNMDYSNSRHQANNPAVQQRFTDNQQIVEHDPDVSELKAIYKTDEAIVIGAGPSLEQHYEKLAKLSQQTQRPVLIAVDTALRGLLHHGVKPDIVVAIDDLVSEFQLPLEHSDNLNLVYFPRVRTALLNGWRGARYKALGNTKLYEELAQSYPNMTRLYSNGSVIHPAIDLAVLLGCKQIYLCGSDFCFCGNKSHAFWDSYANDNTQASRWMKHEQSNVNSSPHWVLNGYGEKVMTTLNLRAYLRYLEFYVEQHPLISFHQCSQESAQIIGVDFRELP